MLIELIPEDVYNALGNDKPPSAGRASFARLARPPEVIKVHCCGFIDTLEARYLLFGSWAADSWVRFGFK